MQIVEAAQLSRTVLEALQQVIVGKEQVLQHLLLGLYSGGNILIEDFPGLAKTLTARLLAQVTGLDFKRIQFTPDLLPGDITGGLIYNQKQGEFEFRPGPLFTNLRFTRSHVPVRLRADFPLAQVQSLPRIAYADATLGASTL